MPTPSISQARSLSAIPISSSLSGMSGSMPERGQRTSESSVSISPHNPPLALGMESHRYAANRQRSGSLVSPADAGARGRAVCRRPKCAGQAYASTEASQFETKRLRDRGQVDPATGCGDDDCRCADRRLCGRSRDVTRHARAVQSQRASEPPGLPASGPTSDQRAHPHPGSSPATTQHAIIRLTQSPLGYTSQSRR